MQTWDLHRVKRDRNLSKLHHIRRLADRSTFFKLKWQTKLGTNPVASKVIEVGDPLTVTIPENYRCN